MGTSGTHGPGMDSAGPGQRTAVIRDARLEDASRLLEIYGYYVRETAVSFEYEVPTLEEFEERMRTTMRRYPYLVVEEDGCVMGYAYAGPLGVRAAFRWSCELSIYLDRNARGHGLGTMLYETLEDALRQMGVLNLYACIALPRGDDEYLTTASAEFHARRGYERVAHLHACGGKFGHWYDIIWMEKIVGAHTSSQSPPMIGAWAPPVTQTLPRGIYRAT